ncbi:hypothetical protein CROQUDRAFT_663758 [Cronartium quercuum f. sp. fusiforme G11]|uniref:Uncharacterized protein n=1 Tax=Cronartium quercuum f. sp. fusiforme G11 TaxID=708437 RepID=A0A9P6N8Y3_9BASI|nr:hypothetical protein CROQUDRAFT_663758 [Cronartium quercuum f. sp. fusiforme G11]
MTSIIVNINNVHISFTFCSQHHAKAIKFQVKHWKKYTTLTGDLKKNLLTSTDIPQNL